MNKQDILNAVCSYYRITPLELFKRGRKKEIVLKRQIATYLLLTDTKGTLDDCLNFIYDASTELYTHSTIIYSRDAIYSDIQHYPSVTKSVNEIRELYPKKPFEYLKFQNSTISNINYSYLMKG